MCYNIYLTFKIFTPSKMHLRTFWLKLQNCNIIKLYLAVIGIIILIMKLIITFKNQRLDLPSTDEPTLIIEIFAFEYIFFWFYILPLSIPFSVSITLFPYISISILPSPSISFYPVYYFMSYPVSVFGIRKWV